jgi:hypothetical protein
VTIPSSAQEPATQDRPPRPPGIAKAALNLPKKTYDAILGLGNLATAILAIAALATGAGGVFWFTHNSNTNLTIDPPEGPIPHCAEFHGSAPAIKGKELWLALHITTDGYLLRKAEMLPNARWRVRTNVGNPKSDGLSVEITVFDLNESDSRLVDGAVARTDSGEHAYITYKELPPLREHTVTETFVRGPGPAPCRP